MDINYDGKTVEGFGQEWTEYDQSNLSEKELKEIFDSYFELFPFGSLPKDAIGFDMGCGSGRWSKLVAPQVGRLYCIDASNDALKVAQKNLANLSNCEFLNASFEDIPLNDHSMDFGYCLGVFHCIPNVAEGMKSCVKKLKPGAPFLVYIYYAFDNRPMWFRAIWRVSDVGRKFISRLPFRLKNYVTKFIALFIYYPFSRTALLLELLGFKVDSFPLSAYRNRSLYTMKTDAMDRFGTRLEKRFTKSQIQKMMEDAGLDKICFSEKCYWAALGYKK